MQISKYNKIGNKVLGVLEVGDEKYVIEVDTRFGSIEHLGHYSDVYYKETIEVLEDEALEDKLSKQEE